ncbi:MAG: hypothetical protein FWC55_08130 [Firmicutes bacterium]|nr:hypothetical protein [Bacillota bacterium]
MKNLKDYRVAEQTFFILANALIFLFVHGFVKLDPKALPGSVETLGKLFNATVVSVIAFGFVWFVECVFTSGAKEKLLYLFGRLSPPGCGIFSEIRKKDGDSRFTCRQLAEKYPELYKNLPNELPGLTGREKRAARAIRRRYENRQWYAIYDTRRDADIVLASEREALMSRDIYISSLVMIALYGAALAAGTVSFRWPYLLFLCAVTISANFGANRKAKRFAYNVVAYDVNK